MKFSIPQKHNGRRRTRPSTPTVMSNYLFAFMALAPSLSTAIQFTAAPETNLDFSKLGRVGIAGDFTGLSLYEYEGQNETPPSTNASESLLAQLPNGVLASLASTDASIESMCLYAPSSGTDNPVVVLGGNFTSVDGKKSQGIALFDPDSRQVSTIDGLEGKVTALLCDGDTVYVGGNFKAANSANAVSWSRSDGIRDLSFAGFNGPVTSIAKASNGHIIFGGRFTGLGNATTTPSTPDGQVINLSAARITGEGSSTTPGFSDPASIVCKTGQGGPGNTWLLLDNGLGAWVANFDYTFQPTKLRLYNTRQDGRGTKTWRFTALPLNGILELRYVDPATGQNATCTNQCPLSNDANVPFQDFHFVRPNVAMSSFRIDISEFFGSGAGLAGIELFADDVFAYAVNGLNEPACAAGVVTPSRADAVGPFTTAPAGDSAAVYLSATLPGPVSENSASVVFFPDIRESGTYSVNMYTPGCTQDNTCATRGQVNVTGIMSSNNRITFSTSLFQTNNFDKFDQIYLGAIDASSPDFRPSITITPLAGQSLNPMTFVAQRIGFNLLDSTGGLNGLFDNDPTASSASTAVNLTSSSVNRLGTSFSSGSAVRALATSGDVVYVGGNFTSSSQRNIVAINTKSDAITALDGGVNGEIFDMHLEASKLYVGGLFSNTLSNSVAGMANVAVYDVDQNSWGALGAGVDGRVMSVVPLQIPAGPNSDDPLVAIAFTGDFSQCLAFGNNPAVPVSGLAVWLPSRNNWLQNLDEPFPAYSGSLTAALLNLPGGGSLYAGSVSSSQLGATSAATFTDGTLGKFPVRIQPGAASPPQLSRRAILPTGNITGVTSGAFYESGGRNMTILAGHFTAQSSSGTVQNLVFIDGADSNKVSGVGSEIDDSSVFLSVAVQGDTLIAGGSVSGNVGGTAVRGVIAYDLVNRRLGTQPPALSGGSATVAAVAARPSSAEVYVGGDFEQAGALPCPAVCAYNIEQSTWSQPGINVQGTVQAMLWTSSSALVIGGDLVVNQTSSTPLARWNAESQVWDSFPESSSIPGPVEVIAPASGDMSQIWIAGHAANGGASYVMKFDGSKWIAAPQGLLDGTTIKSLQVFSLTDRHDSTDLLPNRQSLLLTGSIVLPDFGSASAVIFDGTSYRPYVLATNAGNAKGSIAKIFTQNQDFFTAGSSMPLVFVVLIGLAVSLGLMLLIVLAGVLLDRYRKKRDGYIPAPTSMYDRSSGIQRIPPSELFQSLNARTGAPHV